jgi:hypothetical protein
MIDRIELLRAVRTGLLARVPTEASARNALLLHLYDHGEWHVPGVEQLQHGTTKGITWLLCGGFEYEPLPPLPERPSTPDPRYYIWDEKGFHAHPYAEHTWRICRWLEHHGRPDPYPRIAQLRAEYRPHVDVWRVERDAAIRAGGSQHGASASE